MTKVLVIDGYNVLGKYKSNDRETLLSLFSEYLQTKPNLRMTVIFDATKKGARSASVQHNMGMEVIYTRKNQTADQYILEYLDLIVTDDCLVISSDREVQSYARQKSCDWILSETFLEQIRKTLSKPRHNQFKDAGSSVEEDRDKIYNRSPLKKRGNPKRKPKLKSSKLLKF